MDSPVKLIFVCFLINSISLNDVSTMDTDMLENVVYYDDSEISKMSAKDIFSLHHAFVDEHWKWKDGRINFKIDRNFNDIEIDKILAAMYEIERSSCIRFVAHKRRYGPDYVMIKRNYANSSESSSDLGCCHWGEQLLELATHALDAHKTILHQFLHTIGFDHHHKRSDRDKYIRIHLENTNLSDENIVANFVQLIPFDPLVKYLTPFDFNSVMLYGEREFSINNKPVITSKMKGSEIPLNRKTGLSKYDIILLNQFYDCHTANKTKSKIFYEDEGEIVYPWVVNYHEIERAKSYVVRKEREDDVESQVNELLNDLTDNYVIESKDENDKSACWHDNEGENDIEKNKPTDNCKLAPTKTKGRDC